MPHSGRIFRPFFMFATGTFRMWAHIMAMNEPLWKEGCQLEKMYENEPLLYVAQPELERPACQMQEEFISFFDEEMSEAQKNIEKRENGSFKQLSIDEKIDYLVQLPQQFIQMKCKIETKEKTFRGSVMKRTKNEVELKHSGGKTMIPIAEIISIELIGL